MSLVVAPGTPYVTPDVLTNAPTGISWSSLAGRGATPEATTASQLNLCMRATSMVDGYCHQPLRATVDTETLTGPDGFRMAVRANGTVRLLMSRRPVTQIVSGQVSSAQAFPQSWRSIAANQMRPERPLLGVYGTTAPGSADEGGQAIILAPGLVSWGAGRLNSDVQVTYVNGWPHGSLTGAATANSTSLAVDDITGWNGAAGIVMDGATQETISVTGVTPGTSGAISGPGTLTLATPLANNHSAGALVTALPGNVVQAAILFCVAQALVRGATATTVQTQPGAAGGGLRDPQAYADEAELLIHRYQLVI